MLSLLLDEQISPVVAVQMKAQRPEVPIESVYQWREGALAGKEDALLLEAASQDHRTLVTYDLRTIPPLLVEWANAGTSHGGVVFIDQKTIAPNDYGGMIRGLATLWDAQGQRDWTDRIIFL